MKTPDEIFYEEEILIHHEYLKKYLRVALCNELLAEDILQETMAKAWEKIHLLKDYRDVRAALRKMATNIFLNYRNAKKNNEFFLEEWEMESKLYTDKDNLLIILDNENRRIVFDAIGRLKEPWITIILLRYYYELPFKEISILLQINYSTVLSHHRRAIAQLKKILIV